MVNYTVNRIFHINVASCTSASFLGQLYNVYYCVIVTSKYMIAFLIFAY